MPTIVTHALVPLAAATLLGGNRIARPVALAGAALAMAPDLDVIGFPLGVAYADQWGHRGASHSIVFALLVAAAIAALWPAARRPWPFLFLWLSMASHGLLDMLTDGGLGVALLWPVDEVRRFAPWTPIRVSPIGAGFFSARGLETLLSEIALVWLPCLGVTIAGWTAHRARRKPVS